MKKKVIFTALLFLTRIAIIGFNAYSKQVSKEDTEFLSKYGYKIEEVVSVSNKKLPDFNNVMSNDLEGMYFLYNNELSKDIGLDMSKSANNRDVKMYILKLKDINNLFYPYEGATYAALIKHEKKIVGAYLFADSYSFLDACSLNKSSFNKTIHKEKYKNFYQWYGAKITLTETENSLYNLPPEEIIKKYYIAENESDVDTLIAITDKLSLFDNISVIPSNGNFENHQEEWWKNVKSVKLTDIKKAKSEKINNKYPLSLVYHLEYTIKYKVEEAESNGSSGIDCYMIKPSKDSRWMIQRFGRA